MAANLVAKTSLAAQGTSSTTLPKARFVVHDHYEPTVSRFLSEHSALHSGVELATASSPGGIARQCSTIFTMLPSSPQVQDVYLEEGGILQALADYPDEPALCIDCTTLDQAVAKAVAAEVMATNSLMLDAPVSGGVVGAAAGTLSFMVGGPREAFAKAESLFALMGRRAVYCGSSGNGLAAKIANNLLLGISMLGTAEAMLLGTKLGLEPALLADILNTSTGKCWSSEINNPYPGALPKSPARPPADRNYQGGFLSKLMAKDLRLAVAAAEESSVKLPSAILTSRVYDKLAASDEFADLDFSVVLKWLEVANEGMQSSAQT